MQAGHMAYDRAITVFSPDGRLFQVEYAREAVKRGTTTVGLKFKDGVVLIVDKRLGSKLVEPESIEKIFKIDGHIGCATSGLVADARALVDRARVECQVNSFNYSEDLAVESLAKKLCDYKQSYTQYGGVRPFGTAMLIGGVDGSGPHLFETDPSGALTAYKAGGIGAGRNEVMEIFEKEYKEKMSQNQAINLGLKGLSAANENNLKADVIEIAIINTSKGFHTLDSKSVGEAVKKIK
ncbi:MAG TPA: archaeal proteasome endopeptidase complex subunit alpha [Candidatus Poseidoniia archaeon]|jgi:proteasome alpha subunit|nr:archaeal proteasome endopeptidase complex subunit alpha [Candidatus Poseidoniia archaeon]|tara:strand:+ start:3187 stop:3900 length:714 start_codon:yes stop_codon:yes gene_type:complete